jgi:hypothetical protein
MLATARLDEEYHSLGAGRMYSGAVELAGLGAGLEGGSRLRASKVVELGAGLEGSRRLRPSIVVEFVGCLSPPGQSTFGEWRFLARTKTQTTIMKATIPDPTAISHRRPLCRLVQKTNMFSKQNVARTCSAILRLKKYRCRN